MAVGIVATSAATFECRPTSSCVALDVETKRALLEGLRDGGPEVARPLRLRAPHDHTAGIVAHVDCALNDIDGCFEEWFLRNPPEDIAMTMTVALSHRGDAEAHVAHEPYNVLAFCLERAMERVKFPAGPDDLDFDASIMWSKGQLILSPAHVRHRPPSADADLFVNVDPYRETDRQRALAQLRHLEQRRDELVWRLNEAKREYAQHRRHVHD